MRTRRSWRNQNRLWKALAGETVHAPRPKTLAEIEAQERTYMTTNLEPYIFRDSVLPDNLRDSLDAYVESGRATGGFLQACINNDLGLAVSRADAESLKAIPAIIGYLYNECPSGCSGKDLAYEAWIDKKRAERKAQDHA